jgi:GGDEF domain-containing protein
LARNGLIAFCAPLAQAMFIDPLSVSTGTARYPSDAESMDNLIRKADSTLYNAKKKGQNQGCIYVNCQKKTPITKFAEND